MSAISELKSECAATVQGQIDGDCFNMMSGVTKYICGEDLYHGILYGHPESLIKQAI